MMKYLAFFLPLGYAFEVNLSLESLGVQITPLMNDQSAFDLSFLASMNTLSSFHPNKRSSFHPNKRTQSYTCSDSFIGAPYSPSSFCSGVVDYSFYLPNGTTLEGLNTEASNRAAKIIPLLSTMCLTDLKRQICANIYLPCSSSGGGSPPLLPFKRPCVSLCTNPYTSCGPILASILGPAKCDILSPLTGLPAYDNSTATCNNLDSTIGKNLVGESVEPYIGTVCKGITKQTYISSLATPGLAPLLPPFVKQKILENNLLKIQKNIPSVMPSTCLLDQSKMMCGLYFMSPEPVSTLKAYFGVLHFPQFPDRKICTNFHKSCAALVALSPLLNMNCSGISGTSQLFPTGPQVVTKIPLSANITVPIVTSPNTMNDTTAVFQTTCPYGYVVPDQPEKKNIGWIAGTGCALACPMAVYTPGEYKTNAQVYLWTSVVGFLATLVLIVNYSFTSKEKRNVYLLAFAVIDSLFFISQMIILGSALETKTSSSHYLDFETLVCDSNASMLDYRRVNDMNAQVCNFQGVMFFIFAWSNTYITSCVTIDLWLRVVLEKKSLNKYYFIIPLGIVMIIYSIVYLYKAEPHNGKPFSVTCVWMNPDTIYDMYIVPMLTVLSIVSFLYFHAVGKCLYTAFSASSKNESFSLKKIWKSFRVLFLIGFEFLFGYGYPLISYAVRNQSADENTANILSWFNCLMMEFIKPDNPNYLSKCGHYPSKRESVESVNATIFLMYFTSLFFMFASLSADAKATWFSIFVYLEEKCLGSNRIKEYYKLSGSPLNTSRNKPVASTVITSFESAKQSPSSNTKFKPKADIYTVEEQQQSQEAMNTGSSKIVPLAISLEKADSTSDEESKESA